MNALTSNPARTLLRQGPEILGRWERRVRAEIPASRAHEPLALRNNLGVLLQEVAKALAPTGDPDTMVAGLSVSQDHGSHRAGFAAYSLDTVFLEYRLLRQTIFSVLADKCRLTPEQRETVNDVLARATQDAVSEFARIQQDAERARTDEARRISAELRGAYERERRIAQFLQRPLLLHVAEDAFPGLSLATLYEPAREEAEIGGDFLDAFALPHGRVALVVADACGKGLEAAVGNTHARDLLRAFLRETPRTPGGAVARVNNAVYSTLQADAPAFGPAFIVASVVVVDPLNGEAIFVSAGAEPPLLVRAGHAPDVVPVGGAALGILPDQVFEETLLRLDSGDAFLMVTDGITEARSGGRMLGHEGLFELARRFIGPRSLCDAAAKIMEGARDAAGGSFLDDACLILARRA